MNKTSAEFRNGYNNTAIWRTCKTEFNSRLWSYGSHHKSFGKNIINRHWRKLLTAKSDKHFVVVLFLDCDNADFAAATENLDRNIANLNRLLNQMNAHIEVQNNKDTGIPCCLFLHFDKVFKIEDKT